MTIPMMLTLARLLMIPLFVLLFYLPFKSSHYAAAILFALAALTDFLDGYLARSLKQTSKLGAFLDPVADKLMVAVALVLIVAEPGMYYLAIPAAIIVGREMIISALREWMAELGNRASVAVTFISKIKTAIQMVAVIVLLLCQPVGKMWVLWLGYFLTYTAAALTLWTMFMYLKVAWPELVGSVKLDSETEG